MLLAADAVSCNEAVIVALRRMPTAKAKTFTCATTPLVSALRRHRPRRYRLASPAQLFGAEAFFVDVLGNLVRVCGTRRSNCA